MVWTRSDGIGLHGCGMSSDPALAQTSESSSGGLFYGNQTVKGHKNQDTDQRIASRRSNPERSTVVKKGGKLKAVPFSEAKTTKKVQPSKARMKMGATLEKIMTDARAKLDLRTIHIPAVKVKTAQTRARILEIPGATSGNKADLLASMLREIMPHDSVRVTRPTKCATKPQMLRTAHIGGPESRGRAKELWRPWIGLGPVSGPHSQKNRPQRSCFGRAVETVPRRDPPKSKRNPPTAACGEKEPTRSEEVEFEIECP
ncbi:hypothetical protein ACJJTC_016965 [Scirpophaga incertulas]